MLKALRWVGLGLVIGFLIGGVGVMAYFGHSLARGMFLLQEADLVTAKEAATQAYLTEPPEVGIWAMAYYLDFFEEVIEQRTAGIEEEGAEAKDVFILAAPELRWVGYARLGLLYEKTGNQAKRDEAFRKAAAVFDKEVNEGSVEDYMRTFVQKWDERQSADLQKEKNGS